MRWITLSERPTRRRRRDDELDGLNQRELSAHCPPRASWPRPRAERSASPWTRRRAPVPPASPPRPSASSSSSHRVRAKDRTPRSTDAIRAPRRSITPSPPPR
jgi:hypothetical protein